MRCTICGAVAGDCGTCPEHFMGLAASSVHDAFSIDFSGAMDALIRFCIWTDDPVAFQSAMYAIES